MGAGRDPRVVELLERLTVEPALAARIERLSAVRLMGEQEPPQGLRPEKLKLHLEEPRDWYAGYLGVRGEYQAPFELRRDLQERVPQALLRDLLRPVMPDPRGQVQREPVPGPRPFWAAAPAPGGEGYGPDDGQGQAVHDESPRGQVRAAMATLRLPLPEILPSTLLIEEDRRARQLLLRAPWQPWLPDDAPRQSASDPHSNFGEGFSAA